MIGRQKELQILNEAYNSDKAEMIAVYGRRRIGKTYMIREFYAKKPNTFALTLTGQSGDDMKAQIRNTARALKESCGISIAATAKWDEVFAKIKEFHQNNAPKYEHFVLFIDELPWIATAKSGFVGALGYAWNTYFSMFTNTTFVLCGSAAAWMLRNIASNKGELHGRITRKIALKPFSLSECEEFLISKGFSLPRKYVVDYYIALGGVAQYLNHLDPTKSNVENIDRLCFKNDGILRSEFTQLFTALFGRTPYHQAVVEKLGSTKSLRFSAAEIAKALKIDSIANVYAVLEDLEAAGFVAAHRFYGQTKRDTLYSLCDPYSYFYLKWIKGVSSSAIEQNDSYWGSVEATQGYKSWSANAFEMAAHNHIAQIKKALGIGGVRTDTYYWIAKGDEDTKGAQIDMLIKRADRFVTIVECKYCNDTFVVDAEYETELENKKNAFMRSDKGQNGVTLALLTTFGAKLGGKASIFFSNLTMDALFEK